MPPSPDPLEELFKAYPQPPRLATDFKAQVQQRIAAEPASRSIRWWQRLDQVFAQPAFAAVFIVACVLLGLLVAELRVGVERDRTHARVVNSYLQLINPRIDPPAPAVRSAEEGQS